MLKRQMDRGQRHVRPGGGHVQLKYVGALRAQQVKPTSLSVCRARQEPQKVNEIGRWSQLRCRAIAAFGPEQLHTQTLRAVGGKRPMRRLRMADAPRRS